ncbi:MAG: serine hydrolase [Syntrophomonadaceae bacterium]|nr:serine hydrolase [Syntrophomonadaceae bacterium]
MFKEKKKRIIVLSAAVLMLIFLLSLWFFNSSFWKKYTMFEAKNIAYSLQNMTEVIPYHTVKKSEDPYIFEQDIKPLNLWYSFAGEEKLVANFLKDTRTSGLLVVKDNKIVYENYFKGNSADNQHMEFSVTKSVVSALVGIAIDEGYIKDVNEPITNYLPELKVSGYNDVPIKDILQMSSGVKFDEDYANPKSDLEQLNWHAYVYKKPFDDFILNLKSVRTSGEYNNYISINTQVLGMLVERTTGEKLADYLEAKIWQRIGMEDDAYWLTDYHDNVMAFGGLNITLRDLAKFATLYMNKGLYNGEQIISENWIEESTKPDATHLLPGLNCNSDYPLGYQYQWWVPESDAGEFLAIGIWGQYAYINPQANLVIVKNSSDLNFNNYGSDLETLEVFRSIVAHLAEDNLQETGSDL